VPRLARRVCRQRRQRYCRHWSMAHSSSQVHRIYVDSEQVLLAFYIVTTITILISWILYLIQPEDPKLRNSLNGLDQSFLRWIQGIPKVSRLPSIWVKVCQKVLMILSDNLIITGIAVLTAGYIQSCNSTLSFFDFHIVTWLGWLSSVTHQATLTTLRGYLREHRPVLKYRVAAMSLLFFMLFAALSLYAMYDFDGPMCFDSPVICAWTREGWKNWGPDNVFSICLLTLSYLGKLMRLFVCTSDFIGIWLRRKPSRLLNSGFYSSIARMSNSRTVVGMIFWKLFGFLFFAVYVWVRALYDLFESTLSELIWLTLSFFWAFAKIHTCRSLMPRGYTGDPWAFGQLLALLLLAMPLMVLPELYSGKRQSHST